MCRAQAQIIESGSATDNGVRWTSFSFNINYFNLVKRYHITEGENNFVIKRRGGSVSGYFQKVTGEMTEIYDKMDKKIG